MCIPPSIDPEAGLWPEGRAKGAIAFEDVTRMDTNLLTPPLSTPSVHISVHLSVHNLSVRR